MLQVEKFIANTSSSKAIDSILLKHQDRYLRKKILISKKKNKIFFNFTKAVYLKHNTYLITTDHKVIKVLAKKEKIIQINIKNSKKRCEVAWHIGNRHMPAQVESNKINIMYDPVIFKMLKNLGYKVSIKNKIFDPIGGAYDHKH